MWRLIVLALLLVSPVQAQERVSIADCLLKGSVSIEQDHITGLAGVNAWDGGAIMQAATRIVTRPIQADNGWRYVTLWAYEGDVYAFVFKPVGQHGDCFLRVVSDG